MFDPFYKGQEVLDKAIDHIAALSKDRNAFRIKMLPVATHLERRHRIRRYCKAPK